MESRRDVYDVIVVGAGIEGSATAYQLVKKGQAVLLLEQFPLPHSRGSSHGQTRVTRKAYGEKEYYTAMMQEAFRMVTELERESGETLFRECGGLFMEQSTTSYIDTVRKVFRRHKIPYEDISFDDMKKRFPNIAAPKDFQFFWDKSAGILRADKMLQAFQNQFVAMGGALRDGEPMTDVAPGHVVTVTTSKGQYRGKSVVLTLGPWAANFLPTLGVHVPLQPLKMDVLYWKERVPGEFRQFPSITELDVCGKYLVYGLPSVEYPGLVKFCLHAGPVIKPDERDNVDSAWVVHLMEDYISRRFPTLEPVPSVRETCIYTSTPDADFILDTHPKWKNVVIGAGFSGHGFKLSPVVGKILSELVLGEPSSYDLNPFKMDRFNKSKL